MKRPRVKLQAMAPTATDLDLVKSVFRVTIFNADAWLRTLSQMEVKQYTSYIMKNRNKDSVVSKTVEFIKEYKLLEDIWFCFDF